MNTKKLTINVPMELHDDFKAVAFFKKGTMTEMMLEKIKEVVEKEKKEGVLKR